MKSRLFLLLVLLILARAGAPLVRPTIEHAWFVYQLAIDQPPTQLRNPVAGMGKQKLVNTWGSPRSGGRRHEGIDIFAPRETPVVSTTRGIVTRVGTNTFGGQVVWVLGPALESHYYAHLDRFAEIHRGDIVQAGDVLGYVGHTGNASTTPFHLHYGIYHHGAAENPYPRLTN